MKLLIGEYNEGHLQPGYYEEGDDIPRNVLGELKGRFTKEFREANIRLTETQLKAAATPDQDIIQAVHAYDNIEVMLNSMGKYSTEWFELHHPEKDSVWNELANEQLEEPGLAEYNASVKALIDTQAKLLAHIESQMKLIMPNTQIVAGSLIGAKLLSAAGSLQRLATFPSTTVQLLGAEQALFRHLRQRGVPPPKHGLLINHQLVITVPPRRRGKAARIVANAISIASKVDYYKGEPIGEKLRAKVEAQTSAIPRT